MDPSEGELCTSCRSLDLERLITATAASDTAFSFVQTLDREISHVWCRLCRFLDECMPLDALCAPHGSISIYRFCGFCWIANDFMSTLDCAQHSTTALALVLTDAQDNLQASSGTMADGSPWLSLKLSTRFKTSTALSGFILPAELPPSVGPRYPMGHLLQTHSIDYDLIRSWILSCTEGHGAACNGMSSTLFLDLTLIDCQSGRLSVHDAQKPRRYVALSYVWGREPISEAERREIMAGRLPARVPNLVRDAMFATLSLGYNFLWVDRYCIPQENSEQANHQIHNMDSIYREAELTIIAASGTGSDGGLPGVGSTPRRWQPRVRLGGCTLVSSMAARYTLIRDSSWNQRGWTYQEGVLSRRRLIFTAEYVILECMGATHLEPVCVGDVLTTREPKREPRTARQTPQSLVPHVLDSVWKHVSLFSRRDLTYESDKLRALLGIFRAIEREATDKESEHVQSHHFQGVPLIHSSHRLRNPSRPYSLRAPVSSRRRGPHCSLSAQFLAGLCWELEATASRRDGFPSWSWTGWNSPTKSMTPWLARVNPTRADVSVAVEFQDGQRMRLEEYMAHTGHEQLNHSLSRHICVVGQFVRLEFVPLGAKVRGVEKLYAAWSAIMGTAAKFATYYSPFLPTRKVDAALYSRLVGEQFWGLIIGSHVSKPKTRGESRCLERTMPLILVLDDSGDAAERIGLLDCCNVFTLEYSDKARRPQLYPIPGFTFGTSYIFDKCLRKRSVRIG